MMTEQDANYITLPLHQDRRCEIPTPAGQCTTLAEWQISDGRAWRAICYIHMSQLVREYRDQREFDHLSLLDMDPHSQNTDDLNKH